MQKGLKAMTHLTIEISIEEIRQLMEKRMVSPHLMNDVLEHYGFNNQRSSDLNFKMEEASKILFSLT